MLDAEEVRHTRLFELLHEGNLDDAPQPTVIPKKSKVKPTKEQFEAMRLRAVNSLAVRPQV